MHELAIAEAILDTVVERAGERDVARVDVQIGFLRQVVPASLEFAWQALTRDTRFESTALVVHHVPAVVTCNQCGASTELDLPIEQCGACESFAVTLRSGREFALASFDATESV